MKLCLGTVQLGLKYGVQGKDKPNLNQALHILNKAYQGGISSFDTASAYGDAETILGLFLSQPGINREKVEIISKLQLPKHSFQSSFSNFEIIHNEIRESLLRLNTSYLDGYLFHSYESIKNMESVKSVFKLKSEGLVKKIGVSVYSPDEALSALLINDLDIIQIPYNVLDKRWDTIDFFTLAQKKGIKIYARSVLLQGLLTMKLQDLPLKMEFARDVLKYFNQTCEHYSISPFEAAVSYVYNHPGIESIVFGVDTIEQLNDYLHLSIKENEGFNTYFLNNWATIDPKIVRPDLW